MVRQFSFLFGSHVAGALAMPLFAVGVGGLWIQRRYSLAVLLVATILAAWCGALIGHPFGRSRHTSILALVTASGVAVGIDLILRSRAILVAPVMAVLLPLTGWPDMGDISAARHRRESMLAAVAYLRANVPPGGVLVTDGETGHLLHYYLGDGRPQYSQPWMMPEEVHLGQLHLFMRKWDLGDADTFATDLASIREVLGQGSEKSIWVADGGFTTGLRSSLQQRYPQLVFPEARSFDGAVEVFKLPPGF
jgi:hypothetical protein